MTTIRRKAAQGLQVGDSFTVTRVYTLQDVTQFAAISRDYNPVHFDRRFAQTKHFNDRICHGLLVASLVTEVGGQIGWLASGMNFKFRKPVYVGDEITCEFTIIQIDDRRWAKATGKFTNQNGESVLDAEVLGIVPGPKEQTVLNAMLAEGDPTNRIAEGNDEREISDHEKRTSPGT
jgi:acyl dehydratase